MAWTRFSDRGAVRRVAVVDAYEFPSSVRQRFTDRYSDLSADSVRTVEAAARQWFRLAARHPTATLSMPSVVVDDLWHELALHTQEYADFCEAAFGRLLDYTPESGMSAAAFAVNRTTGLAATLHLAQQDEGCGAHQLPLLFRVDGQLAVAGGRRYLVDCGGRGECFELRGTVCLQHLTGVGKPVRGDSWGRGRSPDNDMPGAAGGGWGVDPGSG